MAIRKRGTQFEQIPMFMDAVSLQRYVTGSVDEARYSPPSQDLWDEKLAESKSQGGPDPSLYDQIRRDGVKTPVTILMPTEGAKVMGEGHHRVAAAADIQRKTGKTKYVPMIHTYDDFEAGDYWSK